MTQAIKNLSRKETKLLATLSAEGRNIFLFENVFKLLDLSRNHAWKFVHTLVDKGRLRRIEKGKYLIIPLRSFSRRTLVGRSFCNCLQSSWSLCHFLLVSSQSPRLHRTNPEFYSQEKVQSFALLKLHGRHCSRFVQQLLSEPIAPEGSLTVRWNFGIYKTQ